MSRPAWVAAVGAIGSLMSIAHLVPAHGVGDVEDAPTGMVGGGWVAVGDVEDRDAGRNGVRLAVDLPCPDADTGSDVRPPGRLQVSWEQQTFQLDAMTAASCSNNLHEGSGTGRCGDERGVAVHWRLADGGDAAVGNPDIRDRAQLEIRGPGAACALSLDGRLDGGDLHMTAPPERRVRRAVRAPQRPQDGDLDHNDDRSET